MISTQFTLSFPKNKNKRKVRFEAYDFKNVFASEGVYGIHKFPAMLHFRLVEELIKEFSREGDTIYDPFCGSGVTLNVAVRLNRPAIGTDINPLALLITKVRSYIDVRPEELIYRLKKEWDCLKSDIPEVRNIDYWFKPYVIRDLEKLRTFLKNIPDGKEKEFLLVVFSQLVRNVSLTRKGEFKRYRMKEQDIEKFNPDVLQEFITLAEDYLHRLRHSTVPKSDLKVFLHDVREQLPFGEKVNLVITSPPYGDSRTTVAYGEFFSFSLEWMQDFLNINMSIKNLDKKSIGGKKSNDKLPNLTTLEKTLDDLSKIDRKRAQEVEAFYKDLYKCIKNIVEKLSENATVCFVVGNRRVRKYTIPMDEIVKEMFESFGLFHYETRIRQIFNKRMPLKNSPTNIKGDKDSTMKEEYIVIMKV